MRRPSLLLLTLVGCRYRLLPESRICEDLAYAISERTYVCEDDAELAEARHDAFSDAAECLLSDEVEDPYNPEGILPADENLPEQERLEGLYDCVRAVRRADCAAVAAEGDDPAWWLGLDPSCVGVAAVEPSDPAGDTGVGR